MSQEIKDAIDKIGSTFEEYKKANDARIEAIKAGNSTSDLDAKLAKMDSAIDQLTEVKAKLEKMETKLARPGAFGDKQDRESPEAVEYKNALLDWVRCPTDQARMQKAAQAQKALEAKSTATVTSTGSAGGFALPEQIERAIARIGVEISPIRQIATVRTVGTPDYKELFDVNKFGKWKFCDEESIREIVGDNNSDMKISVMADVGRCDYKKDIIDKKDSVIDMVRVATYVHQMPAAIEMIEDAKAKGYEVTCNIMAISNAKESDIDQALEMVGQSSADGIYIVDSYGALYPEQIRAIADRYTELGEKYGKYIGMHAHNNQQLAFANTIEALSHGVSLLDATMMSMGRGAGNCAMELLLSFLKNPKYNVFPVLRFLEDYMLPLKETGAVWGYDIPYLLTGRLNQHPSAAIDFCKDNRKDYADFYTDLLDK